MLRWIVGSSLKFRFIVAAAAAALMFFGVQQLRHMPVDVFPEFAPPRVEIQTLALGLSGTEVESLITIPMEQALNGVPELDVIRSKSVEQLSQIEMIFKRGADLLTARQLVAERIATIAPTLPRWAAPPVIIQPLSATSRVMKIGMTSDEHSLIDLSMTAYWKVRAKLLRVPGVANVLIWGERIKMPAVQADPKLLRKHDLTLEEVMTVTSDSIDSGLLRFSEGGFIGRGGFLDTAEARLQVRHAIPIITAKDLAQIPIVKRGGDVIQLSDVADVVTTTPPLMGDGVIDDGPGLLLVVQKLPWANTADVTAGLDAAIEDLRPALPGITLDPTIFRPATFIENAIDNLSEAMIIGALLMILMLGAFLFEWRTALISVTAIPLSLVGAGLVLAWMDVTINTMVLAGLVIALGDIVDDAIIDIENVVRRLREHRQEGGTKSTARVILEASMEVRSAIVYATLIEVVAVVPIFTLEGLSGSFFGPLVGAYALALLVSMVIALTVTPALSLIFFRSGKSLQHRVSPLVPPLQRAYEFLLSKIIYRPRRSYVAVGVTAMIGVALVPLLGQDLLPSFKERDFLMHWLGKPGISRPEEVRTTIRVNRELLEIPGVRNAGSHIGQALNSDEPYGIYFGENWVSVDPSVDYDATLKKIQDTVEAYPGIYRDVQTYLKERIREVLTGSSDAIVIRIFGEDLGVLQEKANEIEGILGDIPGVIDPFVDTVEDIPQIQIEVNLDDARAFGLKPGDVRRSASTLIMGEEVGDIFRRGADLRHQRLEHTGDPREPDRHRKPPDRYALRRARAAQGRRGGQDGADAQRHPPRGALPEHRRQRERGRSRPRIGGRRPRAGARRRRVAARVPCRAARRVRRTPGRVLPPPAVRDRRGAGGLPPAAGVVRQLAARRPVVRHAADRVDRRRDRRLPRRRDHLPRIAGRLLHGPRDRRAERDHADQPLPASRALRGRAVRSAAGDPGGPRAGRADHDDRPHDGTGADPADPRRADPGQRDRAPDGDRDLRRTDHRDAAQPVRRPGPLSPVR